MVQLTQNSIRSLCPADILQNGATVLRENHYLYFLCIQKVFSSLHVPKMNEACTGLERHGGK